MGLMRYQPQGRAQLRRDLAGRVVGALFTGERLELGGSGVEVKLFGNPELAGVQSHGLARHFVSANANYATITPPPGFVDFTLATPFTIVLAITVKTLQTTRVLSYRHAADGMGIQVGFASSGYLALYCGNSSGEVAKIASRFPIEVDTPYVVVCGWDGVEWFMYINGELRPKSNNSTNFVTSNTGTDTDMYIGRRNTGGSHFNGSISLFAHLKGSFDREFLQALSANPWQMWEDPDYDAMYALATPTVTTVGIDLSPSYAVRAAVGLSLAPVYAVRTTVGANLAPDYSVRAAVGQDLIPGYAIRAAVGQDLGVSYAIREGVGVDLTMDYSILGSVAYRDLTVQYAIRGTVGISLAPSYAIRGLVAKNLLMDFSVRSAVGRELNPSYTIAGTVRFDLLMNYAIQAPPTPVDVVVPLSRVVNFDSQGRTVEFDTQGRTVTFDAINNHSVEFVAQGRTVEFVAQSRTVEF